MLRHLAGGETAGPRVSAGRAARPEGLGFRSAYLFFRYFPGGFVVAEASELRVAQHSSAGPLGEFDFCNELGLEPDVVFHIGGGDTFAPVAFATVRKIGEWADGFGERFQEREQLAPDGRVESLADFTCEKKFLMVVVANEEEFEAGGFGPIAADDKFLAWFERKFLPVQATASGFVDGIIAFGDNTFEVVTPEGFHESLRGAFKRSGKKYETGAGQDPRKVSSAF